ncbi:MAG: lysostaphin resistance A-like protein [Desulfomonilaceae bacterium]
MDQFIDLAKLGKNNWWRYVVGVVLILGTPVALAIIANMLYARIGYHIFGLNNVIIAFVEVGGFEACLIVGILLAVQVIHLRPFLTLITPHQFIDWKKFAKSFGLFFGLIALATVVDYLLNPSTYEFRLKPERFLVFAPVALILTPIQTTAEELLFRGYLLQCMALLTRNRVALVLVSGVLFMLPHLANPEMTAGFWPMAFYYFLVGGILTIVTLKSNGLETAMGIHAAINLFVVLIVNYANSALETESIFYCTELDPIFTIVSFGFIGVVFYLVVFGVGPTSQTSVLQQKNEE